MSNSGGALLLALMLAHGAHAKVDDSNCAKVITWFEARGESTKGIAAVRRVIRNRARKGGVGSCKVVKSKGQFSSYKRGMNLNSVKLDENFLTKWDEASKMHVLSNDYTYYFRKDITPDWARKMKCDRVVGKHRFCRDN